MAHSGTGIGLSDTQFDAELRRNEIDHDFFDNPCGNSFTSEDSLGSDVPCRTKKSEDETGTGEQHELGASEADNQPGPRLRLNLDMAAARQSRHDDDDDLVTPDTCVASPSRRFTLPAPYSGHVHSSGGFFNSGMQGSESGPHSSYLPVDPHKFAEQNTGNAFLGCPLGSRDKLFDLSSTSSEGDSDSDAESDGWTLDTEDEEFVNLLEKYYDYIDLGSDNSDLTEVSPMSSFSASPHPSFGRNVQEVPDHADPVYKVDDRTYNRLNGMMGRTEKLPLAKPLPPLIIHTLEDVPIIRPRPATFAQGFVLPKKEDAFPEPLLMKAINPDNNIDERPSNSLGHRKGSLDGSDIKPSSSASNMSTSTSSASFRSKSENNLLQHAESSSMSVPSSLDSFAKIAQFQETQENNKPCRKSERKSADSNKSFNYAQITHVKGTIQHHRYGYHNHQPVKASATIARQRQQRRIEHENSILVRRLQSVKPSKEIVEAFKSGTNNLKCTF